MINWISQFFSNIPGQRLLGYISFRALMAMMTSFLIGVLVGRKIIRIIYQLNFKDRPRDYGDISPKNKDGTPTMGGLIIFLAFLVSLLLWGKLGNFFIKVILLAAFWFVTLGFLDDYLKNVRGASDLGLSRTLKLLFQALFGFILAFLVLYPESTPYHPDLVTKLFIPFMKNPVLDLHYLYYPFIMLTICAIANSINLADGLDGLATVPVALVVGVYAIFSYILGNAKAAEYLLYPYIPGAGELVIALAALIGALAAFLWFNTFPAEVFMGDTGSLFLGGIIGTCAVLIKQEVLFLIAGGFFVIEFLSVFIQDMIGFRILKRRIFYRAPLHHSYQFLGIGEPKIVVRFWIIAVLFTLVSLISIKLR